MKGQYKVMQGSDKEKLVQVLLTGGIAVFPTDTVYGMGARIDHENAVKKIYEIKKRPLNSPMPILLANSEQLHAFVASLDKKVYELIARYWPGSLTIALKVKAGRVVSLLCNEAGEASFRVPNHPMLLEVLKEVGTPIVGTSANIHGNGSAKYAGQLDPELTISVDYVFEGKVGLGIESTVVAYNGESFSIIREAAIKRAELEQVVGTIQV